MKRLLFLSLLGVVFAGCNSPVVEPDPTILRVGVSPRSQPMVFKQQGQIMGIEADFAHALGDALNRRIVFVEVPWNKQIDFLEQNKIDLIMSNMSITKPRSMRIHFTTPYMQSGLSGLFRRESHDPNGLAPSTIRHQYERIGFVKETTGEYFTLRHFPKADLKGFSSVSDATTALINDRIDMLIHDAPVVWWISALNESTLVAFPEVLNTEPLAWGIAKSNPQLLEQVNAQLKTWKEDGTIDRILHQWIPDFR